MSKKRRKTTGQPKRRRQQKDPINLAIRRGKKAFLKKNYDSAIVQWQMVRGRLGRDSVVRHKLVAALAEAYFRRGQRRLMQSIAQACEDLTEAAQLKPDDALYAYHVGLAWHRRNDYSQAVTWYRETLRRDLDFTRVAYSLALALCESGQDPTQDPVWRRLDESQRARLQKKTGDDTLSRGIMHAKRGSWAEAKKALAQSVQAEQPALAQALAHYYLGVAAQHHEDADVALNHWQRAFDTGLQLPHLIYNLTLAYTLRAEAALSAGQMDEALDFALLGLVIDSDHARLGDIQAQIHFERGFTAAEQSKWPQALAEWSQVEKATGTNARALAANTALVHEKREEWVDAAEAWREFARRRPRKEGTEGWLSPEQVARLWTRVSELYMKAGIPEEATTTLHNALKYQPDDVTLGLALARSYISDDRPEAAHNQVDRVLKAHPQNVEAMVLKAELAEVMPRGWFFYGSAPGINEWKRVLETGDEANVPVARQRLSALYDEALDNALRWGDLARGRATALEGLEILPDDHFLRARYVYALLIDKSGRKKARQKRADEARQQIELIDLTDWGALHLLIDSWHIAEQHGDAAATLHQADALKPLDTEFYLGVANCALRRKQLDIAQNYFDTALERTADVDSRKQTQASIGLDYASHGREDKAEEIWQDILKDDPQHGPTHHHLGVLWHRRGDKRASNKHFRQAARWAKAHQDTELLEAIRHIRSILDRPFGGPLGGMLPPLPPGIDPANLPPDALDALYTMFADLDDEDDFYDTPRGSRFGPR